jgi:hypothetical protein
MEKKGLIAAIMIISSTTLASSLCIKGTSDERREYFNTYKIVDEQFDLWVRHVCPAIEKSALEVLQLSNVDTVVAPLPKILPGTPLRNLVRIKKDIATFTARLNFHLAIIPGLDGKHYEDEPILNNDATARFTADYILEGMYQRFYLR